MAGAIWGRVNFGNQAINEKKISCMEQSMQIYKIDRTDRLVKDNVYFSCAHQYVVQGSEREQLPIYDEERQVYFAADCILDNREELCVSLQEDCLEVTDGQLAYRAYLAWGEAFVEHLIGIFSFAIYEKNQNRMLLYTDHTGSRCINYCKKEEDFVFSTTYGPILQAFGEENMRFCEKWLVGCEAFRAPDMILFPGLTPFEGVYQLEAGHYIRVTAKNIKKIRYWNPAKSVKKLRLSDDSKYKQLFLESFHNCVESMLRSNGKTAMTLSSGLDSSAVACVAAPILSERGEMLHTYTSVPVKDFERTEGYDLTDESRGPKLIAATYHNVCPVFVPCETKSAFSEIERFVQYTEVPGKSNANLVWLDDIYRQAQSAGCRVVLKGQFGNSTISYGAIMSLAYQRVLRLKFGAAKEAVRDFMKRRKVTKQNVLHVAKCEWKNKWKPDLSVLEESYVQQQLKEKYQLARRIRSMLRFGGGSAMDSEREHKNFMTDLCILQHLGLYDTKLGLAHGIILRDPTKDKRMIELCMALPMECFVNHGIERRMVREYMEGIVPEEIRNDVYHRGLQSADFVHRLNRHWSEYKLEIISLLSEQRMYQILCRDKIENFVKALKGIEKIPDKTVAQDITVLQSFSLFLQRYNQIQF